METLLTMSTQEFSRLDIMQRLKDKSLKQSDAARMLSMSIRQVQRLYASFLKHGTEGLISKKRGASPNNKISQSIRDSALLLISKHYHDFGPTLAMEKLFENHNLRLSKEMVRQIMVRGGLWKTKIQRLERPYQPRYRRDCYGELIQIDGSDHHWFEDRADRCT